MLWTTADACIEDVYTDAYVRARGVLARRDAALRSATRSIPFSCPSPLSAELFIHPQIIGGAIAAGEPRELGVNDPRLVPALIELKRAHLLPAS